MPNNQNSKIESLPRRNTDPAWLQDRFLATGHDEATSSATFTFVKRKGKIYAVTCGHVLEALGNSQIVQGAPHPTLALIVDRAILNLSTFNATGQLVNSFMKPESAANEPDIDIAIAHLSDGDWSLLSKRKNKQAIDLDAWREPKWASVKYCIAAGYPNEHKTMVVADGGEKVVNQLHCVVAEVGSSLGRARSLIALSSALGETHQYYFSGMSGGPIYAIEGPDKLQAEDDDLLPIGIIFEGYPSSKRTPDRNGVADDPSYLTNRDLFFRGLTLTPEIFDDWLNKAGLS